MKNRGNDGIWELRVLSTCSVNSQNFPRFARIYWKKKWKIGVKIGYGKSVG